MTDSIQDKIAQARQAGYSDDEITAKLAAMPGYGEKIKKATDANYSTSDILSHLSGVAPNTSPAPTTAPATSTAAKPYNPTDDMSTFERVAAGAGGALTDLGLGIRQRLAEAGAYVEDKLGGQNAINKALGAPTAASEVARLQEAVDDKRRLDAPLAQTTSGKVGNFIGTAAPAVLASLVPGGQGFAASVGSSALLGAAQPTSGKESAVENAALGAVGGAAGYGLAKGAAKILSPAASRNASLQLLKNEGVNPTIGQALGGTASRVEQKLTSVPILGDAIVAGRAKAVREFNNAAINRATAPIGVTIKGSGQEAVQAAGNALSKAYDDALSKVPKVTLDADFTQGLRPIVSEVGNLSEPIQARFNAILGQDVLDRFGPSQTITGAQYKILDSRLGKLASDFGSSADAFQRELGEKVFDLKSLLKEQMVRTNPQVAEALKQIDTGWANLVRVEGAAKSAKNFEGVFSPAQLNMAIQGADDSVRKRAVARGTALMQDLGNAGQSVLGATVPDSGTAGRLALGGGALASGFASPAIPLSLAGGAAAYLPPVQKALVSAVSSRPQWASPLAERVARQSAISSAATQAALTSVEQSKLRDRVARQRALQNIGSAQTVDEAIQAASGQ